ncbi:hypothetical protein [Haloarcula sp. JP-L23]|uniref:hypothetical protein n=1 Tax=Haloarcula sp. JP-L23 TaxID=2716717 RepID=UPI00140F1401|nr:hypothetical protein G9465_12225 [Haloarcula sp. JP-L23]
MTETTNTDERSDEEQHTDDTDIYEVSVELRKTAMVAVEAESCEAAWDALRMPHNRYVSEQLRQMRFTGSEYQPVDVITVNDVSEADISLTGSEGDDA